MAENFYRKRKRLAKLEAEAAKATAPPKGYVYFIGAEEVGRVKIGVANYDPDVRFLTLETSSPVSLSKLGLLRGSFKLEGELHERFAKHRVKLEWFRLDAEIAEFIATEALDWEKTIREEKAVRDAIHQEQFDRNYEEMQRRFRAINSPTSTDYMLGKAGM